MKNTWFRLYSEFASDPKVQTMPEAMQRRFVMVLCLKSAGALETLTDEDLAFALRVTVEELAETKALFVRKGFIDDEWNVLNWSKRQYVSDSSAKRTQRYRYRRGKTGSKKSDSDGDVTAGERHGDGGVTPPEQNRAEGQNRTEQRDRAEQNRADESASGFPSALVAATAEERSRSPKLDWLHDQQATWWAELLSRFWLPGGELYVCRPLFRRLTKTLEAWEEIRDKVIADAPDEIARDPKARTPLIQFLGGIDARRAVKRCAVSGAGYPGAGRISRR